MPPALASGAALVAQGGPPAPDASAAPRPGALAEALADLEDELSAEDLAKVRRVLSEAIE